MLGRAKNGLKGTKQNKESFGKIHLRPPCVVEFELWIVQSFARRAALFPIPISPRKIAKLELTWTAPHLIFHLTFGAIVKILAVLALAAVTGLILAKTAANAQTANESGAVQIGESNPIDFKGKCDGI